MCYDYDTSPLNRKTTPENYGMLKDKYRYVPFGCMFFIRAPRTLQVRLCAFESLLTISRSYLTLTNLPLITS